FLPEIEKVHGVNTKQCILLLDNAPSHPPIEHLNAISEQCQVKYLPPNVTSLIQPMNQGIIAKSKNIYKTNLLRVILTKNTFEEVEKQLKSFNLLQCCYLINNAWNELTTSNIKSAWKNIFPFHESSESQCNRDHQLINAFNKFGVPNMTEEINLWLHSDNNDQGWYVLNDEELAFSNNKKNESEKEESTRDNYGDDNTNDTITVDNAFDAFNTFICYFKNHPQSCTTDWKYIYKFWNIILNDIMQST
ncbi:PREDICTED: tigger transposable element-derived protein 2-like, partial [Trachymyrmex cornetzi]|uniref:tigger transposable element-derived protein 2-like n=1 Tax=Trachymyrmex cornetzi TaxID=471704 RepID=UPI00084F13D7